MTQQQANFLSFVLDITIDLIAFASLGYISAWVCWEASVFLPLVGLHFARVQYNWRYL